MKLERNVNTVQKSSNFESAQFGIKNPAIIFDILCNKLYKNPLKTMIQEYMSNARDSHREAGCPDEKIKVILPTAFDPHIKIIDFGVGISPERMSTVFIYLGESTKNVDNTQTGGFGVGAKIAWAYTDAFMIDTIYDGVKYSYCAFMGEDGIPCIDLVSSEETLEHNGTAIIIDIKRDHFSRVNKYVLQISHFWDVRPDLVNANNVYSDFKKIPYSDKFFKYTLKDKYSEYLSEYEGQVCAVVDGIIYDNIYNSMSDVKEDLKLISDDIIFITANTGDVEITVNREALQFSKITNNYLDSVVTDIKNRIRKEIEIELDACETFEEVYAFCKERGNKINIISNLKLNYYGIDIIQTGVFKFKFMVNTKYVKVDKYDYSSYRDRLSCVTHKQRNSYRSYSDTIDSIPFTSFNQVIFHDGEKNINRPQLKAYLSDKGLSSCYVINRNCTKKEFRSYQFDIDLMDFVKTSSFHVKRTFTQIFSGKKYSRGDIRVLKINGSGFDFTNVSFDKISEHADKVIVITHQNYMYDYGVKHTSYDLINYYANLFDEKIVYLKVSDVVNKRIKRRKDQKVVDYHVWLTGVIADIVGNITAKSFVDFDVTNICKLADIYTLEGVSNKHIKILQKYYHKYSNGNAKTSKLYKMHRNIQSNYNIDLSAYPYINVANKLNERLTKKVNDAYNALLLEKPMLEYVYSSIPADVLYDYISD